MPPRILLQYELLDKVGEGGMGEVYRARDTRLGRNVAIKLLPADVTGESDRIRRFQQEARAASALNHPHIVSIFDAGQADSTYFIVMELVEGLPLSTWVERELPDLRRILEVFTQITDALAAAHDAGIVHRDIKPANLLVTPQGYAKVLDFGLAKLTEARLPTDETRTAADRPISKTGVVMGTVAYMSPEQAMGKHADARTDIFSLGGVLYEAVTRQRPFIGASEVDTLHAVIHATPRPVRDTNRVSPLELQWIVDKALAKDLAERYQSMREFAADLRRLRRRLDSSTEVQSLAEFPVPARAIGIRRPGVWATTGMLLIAAAAILGWRIGARHTVGSSLTSLANVTLTPLTTDPGYEGEPTFSPDGETIAYVSDRTGNFEIYLKQVSGGPDINLTNNPADDVQPAFSPDGKQIAFVSSREGGSEIFYAGVSLPELGGDVWVMAALGGTARRIARDGNFPSWSPDGSAILLSAGTWFTPRIVRVPAAGGDPREIPVQFPADFGRPSHILYPRYSRDARWILLQADGTIWVVPAEGGQAQRVVQGSNPVWFADSSTILYSNHDPGKNYALWRVPFSLQLGRAAGSPQPMTVGRGREIDASPSRDANRIAVTEQEYAMNIEELPYDAEAGRPTGAPRLLTRGNDVIGFKSYSPDCRSVVFQLNRGGTSAIWRVTEEGVPTQLTFDLHNAGTAPQWSPDGRFIGFTSAPQGVSRGHGAIWLMNSDGTNPHKLVEDASALAWLPDSRGFVLFSLKDRQLCLYDLTTRASHRLTNEPGIFQIFRLSPDGQWVVFQSNQTGGKVDLHAVPISGGSSRVVVSIERSAYHPSFSPSGRWLYFQPTHKNLYRVPGPAQGWRSDRPEKVTNFPESGLFLEDPIISPDGKRLLSSRGHITGDLWLMDLSKNASAP